MNGNNPLVLVNSDLTELDHIALDTVNRRVYFTEAKAGRVLNQYQFILLDIWSKTSINAIIQFRLQQFHMKVKTSGSF